MKYLVPVLFLLIIACGSENESEIFQSYQNRILNIDQLSLGKETIVNRFTELNDSLQMIEIDLSHAKLSQGNKLMLMNLMDSISSNIYVKRLTHCIIGKRYSRNVNFTTEKIKNELKGLNLDQAILKGHYTETVIVMDNSACEIHRVFGDDLGTNMVQFFSDKKMDIGTESTKSKGTYRYIGNDAFEVSNGWIIKVTDPSGCDSKLLEESDKK